MHLPRTYANNKSTGKRGRDLINCIMILNHNSPFLFLSTKISWLKMFDHAVFAFFAGELSVRYYCFFASEGYRCSALYNFWDFYRGVS